MSPCWSSARLWMGLSIVTASVAVAQPPPIGQVRHQKLATARQEYQRAMAAGDSLAVAEAGYLLGKCYSAFGDYVTAQRWFVRSLRIREPLGPSDPIGRTYLRMAENQIRQNHYEPALRYARLAEANMRAVRSERGLMSTGVVLAGVYALGWQLNRDTPGSVPLAPAAAYDSSLYYSRQAEKIAVALNDPYEIALTNRLMAGTLAQTDTRRGILRLKKAYAITLRDPKPERIPNAVLNLSQQLADYYLTLHQPLSAKIWLDRAVLVRDTTKLGDYWQNQAIEEGYARLYEQTGNWKRAFAHQRNYYTLLAEAQNADREGAIARMQLQYDDQKKDARLRAQQRHLQTQQYLTGLALLLLAVVSGAGAVLFWLVKKYRQLSRHNARLVQEQTHSAKNNLQSIANLLGLHANRLTDPVAKQAVAESLLRVEAMMLVHRQLHQSDHLIEIDLVRFIPDLVTGVLQSYSLARVQPLYDLGPVRLRTEVAVSLGLLLNELVTNSCKYALVAHPNPALEIGCRDENGRFHLWFSDNGPGFIFSGTNHSFGLQLITLLTRKLHGKGQFTTENGCQFTLSFVHKPVAISR